jgi:superoxide dismutase, Fe-Mn family
MEIKETFQLKTFNTPELAGISSKNIEEHLKLYKGYVTNANLILNKINEYGQDREGNSYAISEILRRFAFEFDGMRNHEIYFSQLEGGPKALADDSEFKKALINQVMEFDTFIMNFKALAMTRGVGWAMLYYDKQSGKFLATWVEEQHLGHLTGLSPVLALDMWEHAYVYDYPTSEKKKYLDAFFANLNWSVVEENFKKVK